MDESAVNQFQAIGRDLFVSRLISSHGGNLSVRTGETIYITRTGVQLAHLGAGDIIEVSLTEASEQDARASCELVVHRAIYRARQDKWGEEAGAIVHAHSPDTTVRSILEDVIAPVDSEACLIMGRIEVVTARDTIGSAEAGEVLADALSKTESPNSIAVLRGHGPFAHGATLEDAYRMVSVLEHSAGIISQLQMLR